jgi:hypothetical protein
MVSSPLLEGSYERSQPDYATHLERVLEANEPA